MGAVRGAARPQHRPGSRGCAPPGAACRARGSAWVSRGVAGLVSAVAVPLRLPSLSAVLERDAHPPPAPLPVPAAAPAPRGAADPLPRDGSHGVGWDGPVPAGSRSSPGLGSGLSVPAVGQLWVWGLRDLGGKLVRTALAVPPIVPALWRNVLAEEA